MITYSIIPKTHLERGHRLDAEYYQPEYLEVAEKVNSLPHETLESISESIVSFGAYALTNFIEWQDDGIPFIVAESIKEGFINYEDARCISDKTDEILKKSRVREGQVLLSMSGSVGNAAVAYKIPVKLNSNQDIVKIKLRGKFSPYGLAAFLNSKYGRMQVLRLPVGSVQQHIFIWQTKSLLIPIFPETFMNGIEKIYKEGLDQLQISKSLYSQAEDLLLKELGLKDFKPEEDLSYIVNLSDVKSAHRADAEYFQPKYRKLISKICKHPKVYTLNDVATIKRGSLIDPKFYDYNKGIPYIRGKDFSSGWLEKASLVYISKDFKVSNETRVKKGDLVFASIGSVGTLALVNGEFDGSFISNNTGKITIRNKDEIIPEYLAILLQSTVGKLQFRKEASQTAQPKISDSQVRNFKIPGLPKSTQENISDLVCQSHQTLKKAKELLEKAKREVEEFIEKK